MSKRFMKDIKDLVKCKKDDPSFTYVLDPRNMNSFKVWIRGPKDTPYEGGFFEFSFDLPKNYPWSPPKVLIKTTEHGAVRFNPNLYANGKVCLSILGTWDGPGWTPVQTIHSVILSVQSLMNETPLYNEPGWEGCQNQQKIDDYSNYLRHEVIRVAVCRITQERHRYSKEIQEWIVKNFIENYNYYVDTCKSYSKLDGTLFKDPYNTARGTFDFNGLLKKLESISQSF